MCDQFESMRVKLLDGKNQFEKLKKVCEKKDEIYKEKDEIYKEKDEIYKEMNQNWIKNMMTYSDVFFDRIKELEDEIKLYEKKYEMHENEIDQFWAKRMNTLFDVAYGRIKDLEAEIEHLKN